MDSRLGMRGCEQVCGENAWWDSSCGLLRPLETGEVAVDVDTAIQNLFMLQPVVSHLHVYATHRGFLVLSTFVTCMYSSMSRIHTWEGVQCMLSSLISVRAHSLTAPKPPSVIYTAPQ